ncbi:SRPBCC domain-containing protein [Paenibacillus allorhizoplanae]|uniref:SRPBCC domain-containing protein n=1 Tax=Paenibacillus allorhizoplanae TaxID=2905648 RepID=UPI0030B89974
MSFRKALAWGNAWALADLPYGWEDTRSVYLIKNGSMGFDFGGVYDVVSRHEAIGYTMEDGRRADIAFVDQGNKTKVIETFDAENSNPVEFQQAGWQAIMDNFKAFTEQN